MELYLRNFLSDYDSFFIWNQIMKPLSKLIAAATQFELTLKMAGMGPFSADEAIRSYAQYIWDAASCPTEPSILEAVKDEHSSVC